MTDFGTLQGLIRSGIPGGPRELTLNTLYPHLRQRLESKNLTRLNQRGTDTANQFVFTRNAINPQPDGLAQQLAGMDPLADLGYVGVGEMLTGHKKPPGGELTDNQKQVNTDLSGIRAAVERAIAHLKNWKILSGRYRGPLDKLPSVIKTVVALAFFKSYF